MRLGYIGDGFFTPEAALQGVLVEGYGRTWGFDYHNFEHDPRPNVLILHRFRHRGTGNRLVAGINLNYLNEEQLIELRKALPQILKAPNPRRYYVGQRLLPGIFSQDAWRYYNEAYVHGVVPGTLKTWIDDTLKAKYSARAKKGWKTRRAKAKMAQARQEPEAKPDKPTELPAQAEVDKETLARKQEVEQEKDRDYDRTQVDPEIDMDLSPKPEPERVTGAEPEPPDMRGPEETEEVRPEGPGEPERTGETQEKRPERPKTPAEEEAEGEREPEA